MQDNLVVAAPAKAGVVAAAAGPATAQRFFLNFSDALIKEDPQAAIEELTEALEQKPDEAQQYCQRAYCHILIENYCDAIADIKKSLERYPNNHCCAEKRDM